jgi:PPOX class probable F420-dependent enzyme
VGRSAALTDLPGWARELLERSRVARLGVIADDGAPRVLPVTYALAGGKLVTAVDEKPKRVSGERLARVRWLRSRPQASLTIDRYDDDWSQLSWVQAIGTIEILPAAAAADAISALRERYEPYRMRAPGGPVLVLDPSSILWWRAADPTPAP